MRLARRIFGGLSAGIGALTGLCCISGAVAEPVSDQMSGSFFDLEGTSIDGERVTMSTYSGSVVLVVNTASKCGFTSQYEGLESLYQKFKERGFVVLGFPSNDFMSQEPGTNEDIKSFCALNYGVSFPLFQKASVKGEGKQPVYRFLTEQSGKKFSGDPGWNFVKFLVARDGKVIGRFSSMTDPESDEIVKAIEAAL